MEKMELTPEQVIIQILTGKSIDSLRAWFEQADRVRRAIVGVSTLIERLDEAPNPYYGVVPFDGSLVLCESYGNPSHFFTTLGKWNITGGGCNYGKEATDILNELGIKWTRLKEPEIHIQGLFGGVIQIDEDHFGNKYPPVSEMVLFHLGETFNYASGDKIYFGYYPSKKLFTEINQSDLLRKERN